jgi:catechol 2,3-dioxygenase-like lactoylglutathione lyase family enzyme
MAAFATPATSGVDHVGLSVRDLESTRRFFCDCLGWRVVGERLEYPAAFVSDGQQIVTIEAPDRAVAFDRRTNVGLHHLALAVADRTGLDALYRRWQKQIQRVSAKGRRTNICGHGLLCRGYNIATDAFSKKYAVSPNFGENTGARFQNRKGEQPMTEKAFRFSASTIDELNRSYQLGNKRLPATQFALMLLTLAALLILIYAQIVW